jgi:peptidylprolyl isomerase
MLRSVARAALLFTTVLSAACLPGRRSALPAPKNIPEVSGRATTAFALQWIDVHQGTGAAVIPRGCVYAHYTGWLTDGSKFDSSRDTTARGLPREPIAFPLGVRRVIAGWDAGFDGMRVGGQRRLFIPYQLAYGAEGRGPTIPPKATLIFDIELMAVADTLTAATATPMPVRPTAGGPQCPTWATVRAQ